ncbi:hypothetical protein Taro_050833 [Colocasia esculenta]|uniref:Transposase n=1 Tax=Colocasia esculenta TaxID=4460 RepID=A0A843XED8_COLES|nr:hypothetical protein [Colocasia esculenta]
MGEGSGRRFTTFSTPPPLAGGPTTSAPLPAAIGPTTSASPSHMASGCTPPPSEPDMFIHIYRGIIDSQSIQMRTTTARANFKHLLYNVRRNAKRVYASTYKNQWKEHGPVWMRKEYWMELCVIWGGEKWNENSIKKSYSRGMDERYADDSQHPELDHDIWVAVSRAPKKGHVYGFGHSLGTARVISSCSSSVSHATCPFTTPAAPGGSSSASPAQFREIINKTIS